MFQHLNKMSRGGRCRPHDPQSHFARFGGGAREHFGRSFGPGGGGRERMFDQGEFQLVLLHLIAEKPSYGYELIKTLEEKLAGGYVPSPGVIYPTLTLLEEEGFTTASTDGGRKVYTVTEPGRQHLATNKARLDEIFGRLKETGEGFEGGRIPQIMHSFQNLRRAVFSVALRARASKTKISPDTVSRITGAIDAAAKTIAEL